VIYRQISCLNSARGAIDAKSAESSRWRRRRAYSHWRRRTEGDLSNMIRTWMEEENIQPLELSNMMRTWTTLMSV
jgi:hypothetical protein